MRVETIDMTEFSAAWKGHLRSRRIQKIFEVDERNCPEGKRLQLAQDAASRAQLDSEWKAVKMSALAAT